MITNFETYEGVKWYKGGKLEKDDSFSDDFDFLKDPVLTLKTGNWIKLLNTNWCNPDKRVFRWEIYQGSDRNQYHQIKAISPAVILGIPYNGLVFQVTPKIGWFKFQEGVRPIIKEEEIDDGEGWDLWQLII